MPYKDRRQLASQVNDSVYKFFRLREQYFWSIGADTELLELPMPSDKVKGKFLTSAATLFVPKSIWNFYQNLYSAIKTDKVDKKKKDFMVNRYGLEAIRVHMKRTELLDICGIGNTAYNQKLFAKCFELGLVKYFYQPYINKYGHARKGKFLEFSVLNNKNLYKFLDFTKKMAIQIYGSGGKEKSIAKKLSIKVGWNYNTQPTKEQIEFINQSNSKFAEWLRYGLLIETDKIIKGKNKILTKFLNDYENLNWIHDYIDRVHSSDMPEIEKKMMIYGIPLISRFNMYVVNILQKCEIKDYEKWHRYLNYCICGDTYNNFFNSDIVKSVSFFLSKNYPILKNSIASFDPLIRQINRFLRPFRTLFQHITPCTSYMTTMFFIKMKNLVTNNMFLSFSFLGDLGEMGSSFKIHATSCNSEYEIISSSNVTAEKIDFLSAGAQCENPIDFRTAEAPQVKAREKQKRYVKSECIKDTVSLNSELVRSEMKPIRLYKKLTAGDKKLYNIEKQKILARYTLKRDRDDGGLNFDWFYSNQNFKSTISKLVSAYEGPLAYLDWQLSEINQAYFLYDTKTQRARLSKALEMAAVGTENGKYLTNWYVLENFEQYSKRGANASDDAINRIVETETENLRAEYEAKIEAIKREKYFETKEAESDKKTLSDMSADELALWEYHLSKEVAFSVKTLKDLADFSSVPQAVLENPKIIEYLDFLGKTIKHTDKPKKTPPEATTLELKAFGFKRDGENN